MKVSRDKFERVYKHYSIYKNDRFVITRRYAKGYGKNYMNELKEPFENLVMGLVSVILSPVLLVVVLVGFIPKIVFVDDSINDIKEHPKGQYY